MKKIGNLLQLIRFPTMTSNEFADRVVPTGILTVDQIAKIFTYISASPKKKEAISMEFPINEREPRSDQKSAQLLPQAYEVQTFVTFENLVDRYDLMREC